MRRFICVFLCVLLLFSSFSLTAFADSTADPITDIISFGFDILKGWLDDTNEEVQAMDGDEFYNWYTNNTDFDSVLWRGIYGAINDFVVSVHNSPVMQHIEPNSVIDDLGDDDLGLMENAHYNSMKVSRDILDSLNAEAVNTAGNGIRYFDLSEVRLATTDQINSELIEHSGNSLTACGSSWYQPGDNYYKLKDFENPCIPFYNGGNAPPAFYVPFGCTMYQDGVALPSGRLYFVMGDNLLFALPSGSLWSLNEFYPLYYGGVTAESIKFMIQGFYCYENLEIYSSGRVIGVTNVDWDGWSCADLFEKMAGFIVNTPDYEPPQPPSTFLPDDIPYDDDDNVIVLVPEPGTGGDIIYMSPTDYTNYVNNGTLVEGDYVNNFSDETINNMTNNYNNYITNNTSDGYDDTKLMNKLDTIIDKLNKIIKKMKDKVTDIDVTFNMGDLLGVDDAFDLDGLELDWKSLIQSKLPLLAEAAEVVRGFEEASFPLSIESDVPLPFPVGDKKTIHFAIDFTWYDTNKYNGKTGREYVREGLSYIIYVVAFVALYRRTDSIFFDL